jgi:hypothetical protein
VEREAYLNEIRDSVSNNSDPLDWPVFVELTSGKVIGCDFIVSATGVSPAVDSFTRNNSVNSNINISEINMIIISI